MHDFGGHIHHAYEHIKATLPPDPRKDLEEALKQRNVHLPKMRNRDWAYLGLFLSSPACDLGGVELPQAQIDHMFYVVEMRRLMYRPAHLNRSLGCVLSVICVLIKVVFNLEKGHPRDGVFPRSGVSMGALYGKYFSGIVLL